MVTVPLVVLCAARWSAPDGPGLQPIDAFILSLHSLDTQPGRKVRVLHFGDSHIASDNESAVVRSYLQNLFGDGGPGLELPWGGPHLYTVNFTYGSTYGWHRAQLGYTSPVEDTGLSLSYIEATYPGQRAWIEAASAEFRVYFLAQPGGGAAEFLLDGTPLGRTSMAAASPQVKEAKFQAPQPDALHRFEIRTLDSGPVRILGVAVEKATSGIVYSALGQVGARAEYLLKCREEVFSAQVAAERPDLIILGYGTNETNGSYLDENEYDMALSRVVSRLHRAAPSALVVLLTPADRSDGSLAKAQLIQRILEGVIAVERNVAERDGAVLLDLHAAMGGTGAADRWAAMQPPLARPDMTHFTNEGYNLLGRYIVGGIMKIYNAGADAAEQPAPGALQQRGRLGEILPPLYPELPGHGTLMAHARGAGLAQAPASAQIFYFLKYNGQLIVTDDLTAVDYSQGRIVSAEEAGCVLHNKATPCDNATR